MPHIVPTNHKGKLKWRCYSSIDSARRSFGPEGSGYSPGEAYVKWFNSAHRRRVYPRNFSRAQIERVTLDF